ncbi:hypothetical protein DFJ77DRAFT_444257 [Powellomyces hirtus]|nr:hypothetical protein DFJ77DRAFT_444257 [Powellomyces hirtus]
MNGETPSQQNLLDHTIRRLSRLYIQQRFGDAYKLSRKQLTAISDDPTIVEARRNLLVILYLRVAALRETTADRREDWDHVVMLYGGVVENLPAEVLCAGILLLQACKLPAESKTVIEHWLASRGDDYYDTLLNTQEAELRGHYERVIELYCLHVLPSLEEWESAQDFLEWNEVLSTEVKQKLFEKLEVQKIKRTDGQTGNDSSVPAGHGASVPKPVESVQTQPPVTQPSVIVPTSPSPIANEVSASPSTTAPPTARSPAPSNITQRPIAKPTITKRDLSIHRFTTLARRISPAIVLLLLAFVISRLTQQLKNTPVGRAAAVLRDKIYTTMQRVLEALPRFGIPEAMGQKDLTMHERNPYSDRPDFVQLAAQYEHLRPHVRTNRAGWPGIDFRDPKALRELTCALLWVGFGLRLEIPLDSLCPPVPNRLDYVLTIEDLLEETGPAGSASPIHGIDIGTGASCIYPLLACRKNETWKMLALDIDPRSISYATANIALNKMHDRVKVVMNETEALFPHQLLDDFSKERYGFSMCNPPFYESASQMALARSTKAAAPRAICTGSAAEMITAGGEAAFILHMLAESSQPHMRDRVGWYTSLVGRKDDIAVIENALRELDGVRWVVRTLRQAKTVRWVVAWTFVHLASRDDDAVGEGRFGITGGDSGDASVVRNPHSDDPNHIASPLSKAPEAEVKHPETASKISDSQDPPPPPPSTKQRKKQKRKKETGLNENQIVDTMGASHRNAQDPAAGSDPHRRSATRDIFPARANDDETASGAGSTGFTRPPCETSHAKDDDGTAKRGRRRSKKEEKKEKRKERERMKRRVCHFIFRKTRESNFSNCSSTPKASCGQNQNLDTPVRGGGVIAPPSAQQIQ